MAKRFAGTTEKCRICLKTAYEMESFVYDKQTYHITCFRCQNCKKRMEIREANLYFGDLYCKNCFTRLFKTKGKFDDVFGGKSLPKSRASVANATESGAAVGSDGLPIQAQAVADPQPVAVAAEVTQDVYAQPAVDPNVAAIDPNAQVVEQAPVVDGGAVAVDGGQAVEQQPVDQQAAVDGAVAVDQVPVEQPVDQQAVDGSAVAADPSAELVS